MATTVEQVAIGIGLGIVFGLYGFLTKRNAGEPLKPKKLARTVVIYGAAGAVVAQGGGELTQENIAAATTTTIVLGQIVDMAWPALKRIAQEQRA